MTEGQIAGFWVGYAVVAVIALIIHILLSHAIAKAAERRNRSYWAFFWLSFFVSWIIMGIIVATFPNPQPASNMPQRPNTDGSEAAANSVSDQGASTKTLSLNREFVKCPFCAEEIKSDANLCRFCRSDVSSAKAEREAAAATAWAQEEEARLDQARRDEVRAELARAEEKARAIADQVAREKTAAETKAHMLARREARLRFWKSWKGIVSGAAVIVLVATAICVPLFVSASTEHNRFDWASRQAECGAPPATLAQVNVTDKGQMSFVLLSPRQVTKQGLDYISCLGLKVALVKSSDLGLAINNFFRSREFSEEGDVTITGTDGSSSLLHVTWHNAGKAFPARAALVTVQAGKDYIKSF